MSGFISIEVLRISAVEGWIFRTVRPAVERDPAALSLL